MEFWQLQDNELDHDNNVCDDDGYVNKQDVIVCLNKLDVDNNNKTPNSSSKKPEEKNSLTDDCLELLFPDLSKDMRYYILEKTNSDKEVTIKDFIKLRAQILQQDSIFETKNINSDGSGVLTKYIKLYQTIKMDADNNIINQNLSSTSFVSSNIEREIFTLAMSRTVGIAWQVQVALSLISCLKSILVDLEAYHIHHNLVFAVPRRLRYSNSNHFLLDYEDIILLDEEDEHDEDEYYYGSNNVIEKKNEEQKTNGLNNKKDKIMPLQLNNCFTNSPHSKYNHAKLWWTTWDAYSSELIYRPTITNYPNEDIKDEMADIISKIFEKVYRGEPCVKLMVQGDWEPPQFYKAALKIPQMIRSLDKLLDLNGSCPLLSSFHSDVERQVNDLQKRKVQRLEDTLRTLKRLTIHADDDYLNKLRRNEEDNLNTKVVINENAMTTTSTTGFNLRSGTFMCFFDRLVQCLRSLKLAWSITCFPDTSWRSQTLATPRYFWKGSQALRNEFHAEHHWIYALVMFYYLSTRVPDYHWLKLSADCLLQTAWENPQISSSVRAIIRTGTLSDPTTVNFPLMTSLLKALNRQNLHNGLYDFKSSSFINDIDTVLKTYNDFLEKQEVVINFKYYEEEEQEEEESQKISDPDDHEGQNNKIQSAATTAQGTLSDRDNNYLKKRPISDVYNHDEKVYHVDYNSSESFVGLADLTEGDSHSEGCPLSERHYAADLINNEDDPEFFGCNQEDDHNINQTQNHSSSVVCPVAEVGDNLRMWGDKEVYKRERAMMNDIAMRLHIKQDPELAEDASLVSKSVGGYTRTTSVHFNLRKNETYNNSMKNSKFNQKREWSGHDLISASQAGGYILEDDYDGGIGGAVNDEFYRGSNLYCGDIIISPFSGIRRTLLIPSLIRFAMTHTGNNNMSCCHNLINQNHHYKQSNTISIHTVVSILCYLCIISAYEVTARDEVNRQLAERHSYASTKGTDDYWREGPYYYDEFDEEVDARSDMTEKEQRHHDVTRANDSEDKPLEECSLLSFCSEPMHQSEKPEPVSSRNAVHFIEESINNSPNYCHLSSAATDKASSVYTMGPDPRAMAAGLIGEGIRPLKQRVEIAPHLKGTEAGKAQKNRLRKNQKGIDAYTRLVREDLYDLFNSLGRWKNNNGDQLSSKKPCCEADRVVDNNNSIEECMLDELLKLLYRQQPTNDEESFEKVDHRDTLSDDGIVRIGRSPRLFRGPAVLAAFFYLEVYCLGSPIWGPGWMYGGLFASSAAGMQLVQDSWNQESQWSEVSALFEYNEFKEATSLSNAKIFLIFRWIIYAASNEPQRIGPWGVAIIRRIYCLFCQRTSVQSKVFDTLLWFITIGVVRPAIESLYMLITETRVPISPTKMRSIMSTVSDFVCEKTIRNVYYTYASCHTIVHTLERYLKALEGFSAKSQFLSEVRECPKGFWSRIIKWAQTTQNCLITLYGVNDDRTHNGGSAMNTKFNFNNSAAPISPSQPTNSMLFNFSEGDPKIIDNRYNIIMKENKPFMNDHFELENLLKQLEKNLLYIVVLCWRAQQRHQDVI